jgi:hypothetical protein
VRRSHQVKQELFDLVDVLCPFGDDVAADDVLAGDALPGRPVRAGTKKMSLATLALVVCAVR